jgi:DNA helicase-2/ATP-dependent DNA helicase PcrA
VIDFRKNLNKAQYEAVANDKGPMLILAGAGSGKTRVIEYRTLYLVDSGVNPKSILLLTFTKRAAFEMLSRVVEKDERCQEIEGGTFHSFAYKVLRRYSGLIEIENSFLVLDESDSSDLINQSAKKIGINDKNFPKKETIREIISASINKGMSIGDALEIQYPHFNRFISEIEAIKVEYGKAKKERNYVDYDDLLVDLRLLLKNESIRKELSRRYNYIMVDEYQDTNPIQGEITYLLGKDHQNIVVVGDDAQTIYGFRGSSHKNIMNFPKFFPKSKIVTLESNYRSTQSILDLANAVLENMEEQYSKVLVSGNKDLGEEPKLTCYKDQYSEAHGIATKIESLITNREDVKRI